MTDQEFSCGFKSHAIGEYANGLSKSNQSLHGFSTCTDFCSEFAQIKTWEKPPIKGKFIILECNPLFVHWLETVWAVHWHTACWKCSSHIEERKKGNPIFRILCWNYTIVVQNTNIITHTTPKVPDENCKRMTHTHTHTKKTFERGRKQNLWTVILSFRKREARLPEDIQQINSVASSTEYNLYPTKLISTVTETPERILYTKTQIWLNQI